jgi:hypothetical protein
MRATILNSLNVKRTELKDVFVVINTYLEPLLKFRQYSGLYRFL